MNALILWIAQGLGVGRIPVAPGTFGSIVGLAWTALLLLTGCWWGYVGGSLAGLALSVWLCGRAERILKQTDPGSVVLDEIAAMPLCFVAWIALGFAATHGWPAPADFLSHGSWKWTLSLFLAFRFFDVLKPWPVRQSQGLVGGWGVTIDDVLATVYVNLAWILFFEAAARFHLQ